MRDKVETEFLISHFLEAQMFGVGFLKSIWGTNTWLEVSQTKPKNETAYLRATLGTEYQWNTDLYTIFEFHHNGAGSDKVSEYGLLPLKFAYQSGSVHLLGDHYFSTSFNHQWNPLLTIQYGGTYNIEDHSLLLNLMLSKSLTENSQIDLGSYFGVGHKGQSLLIPMSEFASYGTQFFLKYKHYF